MAKTALDGHWRGIQVVSTTLREAGFEVVLAGMLRPEELVSIAIEEDVDLIGLHVGGRVEVVERMLAAVRDAELGIPVIAGGVIPPHMDRRLSEQGVRTFPPGSKVENIVAVARELVGDSAEPENQ
jgi:methylmalonyl-CoA mutase, C-terminal domain